MCKSVGRQSDARAARADAWYHSSAVRALVRQITEHILPLPAKWLRLGCHEISTVLQWCRLRTDIWLPIHVRIPRIPPRTPVATVGVADAWILFQSVQSTSKNVCSALHSPELPHGAMKLATRLACS